MLPSARNVVIGVVYQNFTNSSASPFPPTDHVGALLPGVTGRYGNSHVIREKGAPVSPAPITMRLRNDA